MQGLKPIDLLTAALVLTGHDDRGRPRQAFLKRAISTAYYAMFHCLSASNANVLIGASRRTSDAWMAAYRQLEHRMAYSRCDQASVASFPAAVRSFADTLRKLKESREEADYNPAATFSRFDAYQQIYDAYRAIVGFERLPARTRKDFAAHILFKKR